MKVFAHQFETELGTMLATCDEEQRLLCLALKQERALEALLTRSLSPNQRPVWDRAPLAALEQQIHEYLAGQRCEFHIELAPSGPPFHRKVWQALTRSSQ